MSAVDRLLAASNYTFRFTVEENGRGGTATFTVAARDVASAWTKIVKEQKNLMKYTTKIELAGAK